MLVVVAILLSSLFVLSSCDNEVKGGKVHRKPVVYAANYPLFYFAERISDQTIDLRFVVPQGGDPSLWQPSDATIVAMQNADLLLMNGATYSKWAESVSLPERTLVDTSKDFAEQLITVKGSGTHSHGDGVAHSHDGTAVTTWLDLNLAAMQAAAVCEGLAKLHPEHRESFESNTQQLLEEIRAIDAELVAIGLRLNGKPLLGSHPVFQYLARRYGLNIHHLNWISGTVPGDTDLLELDLVLEDHPASLLIWETPPAPEAVRILLDSGITSIVFQPCGNRPEIGDWLSVMKENVRVLGALQQ